jgi:lipopolysaccharide export system protein LptC
VSWRAVLTVVLLVAAAISGWSAWQQRRADAPVAAAVQRSDYLLHDFELVVLDKQGSEAFTVRAPRLARNPADRTMALETPVFLLPDDEGHHWQVSANTGWVSADNSELRLRGDVVTTSPQGQGRPTRMNTQQLNVFPDSSVATSADLVTITQPGLTMSGRGMRADLAAKRYTFQSQVRQRYVP